MCIILQTLVSAFFEFRIKMMTFRLDFLQRQLVIFDKIKTTCAAVLKQHKKVKSLDPPRFRTVPAGCSVSVSENVQWIP